MQSSTMEPYVREAEAAFSQVERQLDSITDSIDHFLPISMPPPPSGTTSSTFWGHPGRICPEPAEHLLSLYETYLTSCNSLISESEYCIRHIIYYSTSNIVDMEYSTSGYSRYRIIDLRLPRPCARRATSIPRTFTRAPAMWEGLLSLWT